LSFSIGFCKEKKILQKCCGKKSVKLIFIDHVAARNPSSLQIAQEIFNPFNRVMADGCHGNGKTWTAIQNGAFSQVVPVAHPVKKAFLFYRPHMMRYAIKQQKSAGG
jgi:hypothetical protein